MEEQIRELADAIYVEKVRRARALTVGERIATGIELFENGLGVMRDGIRLQFPEAGESEVEEILKRRLARLRQVHEHGLYTKGPRLDD
ncbi:MAG TPA: hypothetical protein PLA50_12490 [Bacteroidia bacterium]|nr:hypothetical protein [Bacteroidia bacterium]